MLTRNRTRLNFSCQTLIMIQTSVLSPIKQLLATRQIK